MPHESSVRLPLPAWLTTRPIAHRGLHDARSPENTLAAFAAAIGRGYPIELDIHALSDGEVVVFHDADLTRATGERRALSRESKHSIRRHRVFGTDEHIPSLHEVLELVAGRVPLLIEIKATQPAAVLGPALLAVLSRYQGPVALQSFDPWALAYFRVHAPELVRGQLGGPLRDDEFNFGVRIASRLLLTWLVSRAHFVNYDLRALPDAWVAHATRALSLPLLAWTVRNERDRERAEVLRVNYVFDHIRP